MEPARLGTSKRRPRRGSIERPVDLRLARNLAAFLALPLLLVVFTIGADGAAARPRSPAVVRRRDRGGADGRAGPRQREPRPRVAGGGQCGAVVPRQARALRARRPRGRLARGRSPASVASSSAISATVVPGTLDETIVFVAHRDNNGLERGRERQRQRHRRPRRAGARATRRRGRRESARTPLHTLVFLSSDGGAYGSLGAERFAQHSPLARRAVARRLARRARRQPPSHGSRSAGSARTLRRRRSSERPTRASRSRAGTAPAHPGLARPARLSRASRSATASRRRSSGGEISAIRLTTAPDGGTPPGGDEIAGPRPRDGSRSSAAPSESMLTSLDGGDRARRRRPAARSTSASRIIRGWAIELAAPRRARPVRRRRDRPPRPLPPAAARRSRPPGARCAGGSGSGSSSLVLLGLAALAGALPVAAAAPAAARPAARRPTGRSAAIALGLLAAALVWLRARARLIPRARARPEEDLAGYAVAFVALLGGRGLRRRSSPRTASSSSLPSLYAWLWLPQVERGPGWLTRRASTGSASPGRCSRSSSLGDAARARAARAALRCVARSRPRRSSRGRRRSSLDRLGRRRASSVARAGDRRRSATAGAAAAGSATVEPAASVAVAARDVDDRVGGRGAHDHVRLLALDRLEHRARLGTSSDRARRKSSRSGFRRADAAAGRPGRNGGAGSGAPCSARSAGTTKSSAPDERRDRVPGQPEDERAARGRRTRAACRGASRRPRRPPPTPSSASVPRTRSCGPTDTPPEVTTTSASSAALERRSVRVLVVRRPSRAASTLGARGIEHGREHDPVRLVDLARRRAARPGARSSVPVMTIATRGSRSRRRGRATPAGGERREPRRRERRARLDDAVARAGRRRRGGRMFAPGSTAAGICDRRRRVPSTRSIGTTASAPVGHDAAGRDLDRLTGARAAAARAGPRRRARRSGASRACRPPGPRTRPSTSSGSGGRSTARDARPPPAPGPQPPRAARARPEAAPTRARTAASASSTERRSATRTLHRYTTGYPRGVISVVIPVHDEERSVALLYDELAAALAGARRAVGGRVRRRRLHATARSAALARLHDEHDNVRVVRLRRNFGKAAALDAGFARGDGRHRRDDRRRPAGRPRRDPAAAREARRGVRPRLGLEDEPPRPVHPARARRSSSTRSPGRVSGVRLHDMNCGLKAYRAEVAREHASSTASSTATSRCSRTTAATASPSSPVNHRPREHGRAELRRRALRARLPRPAHGHVHGPLPPPPAPPLRRPRAALRPARDRDPRLPDGRQARRRTRSGSGRCSCSACCSSSSASSCSRSGCSPS